MKKHALEWLAAGGRPDRLGKDEAEVITTIARRVIAAEKLAEALMRIKHQNVHPDAFHRIAAEALAAWEAAQ